MFVGACAGGRHLAQPGAARKPQSTIDSRPPLAVACRPNDTIIDARKRFWVVDRKGLVVRGRGDADSLPDQARLGCAAMVGSLTEQHPHGGVIKWP